MGVVMVVKLRTAINTSGCGNVVATILWCSCIYSWDNSGRDDGGDDANAVNSAFESSERGKESSNHPYDAFCQVVHNR
jgi:hypothetical protein